MVQYESYQYFLNTYNLCFASLLDYIDPIQVKWTRSKIKKTAYICTRLAVDHEELFLLQLVLHSEPTPGYHFGILWCIQHQLMFLQNFQVGLQLYLDCLSNFWHKTFQIWHQKIIVLSLQRILKSTNCSLKLLLDRNRKLSKILLELVKMLLVWFDFKVTSTKIFKTEYISRTSGIFGNLFNVLQSLD